jgi:hypothetical protein
VIKRDDFLLKLANLNNSAYLETLMSDLENFVDAALINQINITQFINTNPSGYDSTSGAYTDGIVDPSQYDPTYAIHRNPDVTSGDSQAGKSGNYTIWVDDSTDLILNGNLVNTTPWLDKTLDNPIKGEFSIQLPANTNKNLALLLAQKYMSTDIGVDGTPSGGYWSYVTYPIGPEYGSTSGLDYGDAVRIKQSGNDLYIIFRLYPL